MTKLIRVLLADDHPLVRAGLRSTLLAEADLMLVGEAVDGSEAKRLTQELLPDVLLLDLNMPGPPASEIVEFMRAHCPAVKVLVLTAYDEDAYIQSLLMAGAAGYMLKDEVPESIVRAIYTVVQGGVWFSRPVAEKLVDWKVGQAGPPSASGKNDHASQPPVTPPASLTDRELGVLQLVVEGHTNQEIGLELGISDKTVEKHLREVFTKLGVASRVEAAVYAVRQGLM
jgi:DNA-binding NarL/FixJ family response regulator